MNNPKNRAASFAPVDKRKKKALEKKNLKPQIQNFRYL